MFWMRSIYFSTIFLVISCEEGSSLAKEHIILRNEINPGSDVYSDAYIRKLNEKLAAANFQNIVPGEQDKPKPPKTLLDPQDTWTQFQEYQIRRNKKNKKLRKQDRRQLVIHEYLQGPPGPQGPPGALITKEELMKEFKEMVKEEAEKRAQILIAEKCPACPQDLPSNSSAIYVPLPSLLPESNAELGIGGEKPNPQNVLTIAAGFYSRLRGNTHVARRSFRELQQFQLPFGSGAFQRGNNFSPEQGRFTAETKGIFQFSVNIHITPILSSRDRRRVLKKRDHVRILICIQSLCQKHASLVYIAGLNTNSAVFSAGFTGILELLKGQYVSVYIDNSSSRPINIMNGSQFSGVMLGY